MISLKRAITLSSLLFIPLYFAGCATSSPERTGDMEPTVPPPQLEKADKDDYVVAVETMPQLKGGLEKLQNKINYPALAKKAGIEGRVIVQFIVNKQGEVEYPEVYRGIGGGCDEEAIRIVKQAEFNPGKHNGKTQRVQYSLPIKFEL